MMRTHLETRSAGHSLWTGQQCNLDVIEMSAEEEADWNRLMAAKWKAP